MKNPHSMTKNIFYLFILFLPFITHASESATQIDLTSSWVGFLSILIFSLAYIFVILEEKISLRKSKPVLVAAGLIWIVIAFSQMGTSNALSVELAVKTIFLDYAELFFFLLVAMTYINAIADRGVFDVIRDWLISKGFTYRQLFWMTGFFAFFISPIADNLTTALIMCAVILAVGKNNSKFISLSCINIVIAANSGGAFSPFGDITTLMVWQKGLIAFVDFFKLFIPSLINYLVPALIMSFSISNTKPFTESKSHNVIKVGGIPIVILFILTIATAVSLHSFLMLPAVIGMMFGLGYLKLFSYYLNRESHSKHFHRSGMVDEKSTIVQDFDVFDKIARAEWDTLFFFYGVILCVGGLGFIGYLSHVSEFFYGNYGATTANVSIGFLSAIIDNIPVMFAVLSMNPEMSELQWLLVTLTVGVGGSLFSIGSAAGIALMGQAHGHYTFLSHLKWTPVILLGYLASIYSHFLING